MARKPNYSFQKHEREKIRQKKKQEKEARKHEAKERKAAGKGADEDTNTGIEDVNPGPQPAKKSEE